MYKVQIYKDGVLVPDDIIWNSEEEAQVLKQALDFYFQTQGTIDFVCRVEFVGEIPST